MNINTTKLRNDSGFTIVELLIVIVVIGILAAITLVAFGGVRDRANTSAAQSAANEVLKKAEIYKSIDGVYPTSRTNTTTGFAKHDESKVEGVGSFLPAAPTSEPTNRNDIVYATCTTGFVVGYWNYSEDQVYILAGGGNTTAEDAAWPSSATCTIRS